MRLKLTSLILAAIFMTAAAAHADVFVSGTAGGGTQTFNLDLNVSRATSTSFDINSVVGTIDGTAVTLISGPTPGASFYSPSGFFIGDNVVFLAGNAFDLSGFLGTTGGQEVNIFYNDATPTSGLLYFQNGSNFAIDAGSVSVNATPEPSSLALLGTGMLAAAGAARRRFLRS